MAEGEQRLQTWIKQIEGLLSCRAAKEMSMSVILQNMPSVPEEDVDKLLTTCSRRGLYNCLILAIVQYGRIERLLRLEENDLTPEVRHLLQGKLLVDLAGEGLWPSWEGLLSCISEPHTRQLLLWLSRNSVNSEALTLFEVLLARVASDTHLFGLMIQFVIMHGLSLHYERFLFGTNNIVQHLEGDNIYLKNDIIHTLLTKTLIDRVLPEPFNNSLNDCLVLTCKSGLLSAQYERPGRKSLDELFDPFRDVSPLAHAVSYNQPDIVRFLYSTKTVSNREVFQLSRDATLVEKCARNVTAKDLDPATSDDYPSRDNVLAAREIRSFLVAKASEPRSLKSLCLAEVSKGLGWGNARKAAVKEMYIPLTLKADLMTNCDRTLLRYRGKKDDRMKKKE